VVIETAVDEHESEVECSDDQGNRLSLATYLQQMMGMMIV